MFEQTFKNIDDVLWKEAGCVTELDYTEQTSWILFLNIWTSTALYALSLTLGGPCDGNALVDRAA
jgi:hypothetical protein